MAAGSAAARMWRVGSGKQRRSRAVGGRKLRREHLERFLQAKRKEA